MKPEEPARALTPSERLGSNPSEREAQPATQARVVAKLDKAIGPKFNKDGDRFTATVLAGSPLPEGSKLVGKIIRVQPAMAGSLAFAVLSVQGVEGQGGALEPLDGRVAGVEKLDEQSLGSRPVNATGAPSAEVIGSIVKAADVPQLNVERDPLGKGTIVSLGTGGQPNQLDAGMRLVVDLRGPGERQSVAGRGELRDISAIVAAIAEGGGDSLAGRMAVLDGVPVESVIGDTVFWVGPSKAQRVLVVLEPTLDTPESRIVVRAGQTISVSGPIELMPSNEEAPRLWKMVTPAEASDFSRHHIYVYATSARIR